MGEAIQHHTAINQNIMRVGKHSVSFHVNNPTQRGGITLGIMRPTMNEITSLNPVGQDLSGFSLWRGHQKVFTEYLFWKWDNP